VRASPHAAWFWALILSTSLIAIVGFSRAGSFVFWKAHALPAAPASGYRPDGALSFVAVGGLLACLVLLTVFAGPVHAWLELAAAQLYTPAGYIDAVLGTAQGVR
jgi:multicomponent K+:H+ antiporter subunit D